VVQHNFHKIKVDAREEDELDLEELKNELGVLKEMKKE
jgi:hypothetical protein